MKRYDGTSIKRILQALDDGGDISTDQFKVLLQQSVADLHGPAAAGRAWHVDRNNVHSATAGKILPGPSILKALNLEHEKEILYRYRRPKK